jgi:hypothetical protein
MNKAVINESHNKEKKKKKKQKAKSFSHFFARD